MGHEKKIVTSQFVFKENKRVHLLIFPNSVYIF